MRIPAKKSLGQHFVTRGWVVARIIEGASLTKHDVVVEIGPGSGILTAALARHAKRVIAIEKDERFVELLLRTFARQKQVVIREGDILKINPRILGLRARGYSVVANIPYYLTGKLLRHVFETWPQPKLIVLMLQKEVARRLTATPPNMNLLALSVQLFSAPTILAAVPRSTFRPQPKVDSAIVKFVPRRKPPARLEQAFFSLIHAGFRHPRKFLVNNLAELYRKERLVRTWSLLAIPPRARPAELPLATWLKMARLLRQ